MASAILHLESVCAVAGALVAGTIIALASPSTSGPSGASATR
jgi:hypothetical protein